MMNITTMTVAIAGIAVSAVFAGCWNSSGLYEARGEFTVETQRYSQGGASADAGRGYAELVSTRIHEWRSEKIVVLIIKHFRASHPQSTVTDEEICTALADSEIKMQDGSRVITVCVRSRQPVVAAALANSYVSAIEEYTKEQNRMRCDMAAASLHADVEKKNREVAQLQEKLLNFRLANKLDSLHASRDMIREGLSKTNKDILELESQEVRHAELMKAMRSVQEDPEKIDGIPADAPCAEKAANAHRAFKDALVRYKSLLVSFTEAHPEVKAAKREVDSRRQSFLAAVAHSLEAENTTLERVRGQLAVFRKKQADLGGELSSIEGRITAAEAGVADLESKLKVAQRVLESLILEANNVRIKAEANNEIIRVGRPAAVPTKRKGLLR